MKDDTDKDKKEQNRFSWQRAAPFLIYTVVGLFFILILKIIGAL